MKVTKDISGEPVVHIPLEGYEELMIPLKDWERPEGRKAIMEKYPDVDWTVVRWVIHNIAEAL